MKKMITVLALAGLCQAAAAAGVQVENPWARSTVQGMNMSGAFMTIKNDEAQKDFLIGGSTPVAERIEVHTHVNDNGVMRMRQAKDGAPLEAKGVTELKPGSYHVMFMGLKKQLKPGDKFPLTLKFKNAKPQTVEVVVKNAPKSDSQHHGAASGVHQH
ncbi:copper chaperone PCu(A)C [Neisseria chenwenguii]|uniref:Uncharacterized protein n=1 Tax=Neisseria chenwenguii TaxID=1853278 RepID=A0A220S3J0_9NEIS|nr:copper chaperone PCu(A)C [Neisseria chenwenguii]ASK27987.1 hypothetical protein BG910_09840 [Neisseria chenwenguii]ROV54456.1 copper chaperone PCu(A)C [Neisseria chenwenguii]